MEEFKAEGKSVGLIFDVSVRHAKSGRRIIDILKKQTINIIRNFIEDGEDYFYLYNPNTTELCLLHGDQVCSVGNYNTDGYKLNLNIALRQTLYVLMSGDLTHRKYLIFITDRINKPCVIDKALKIDQKEMIDCNFILIGVGSHYDKNCLNKFSNLSNVTYFHINEPEELENCFSKENDGKYKSCCETDEQCERIQLTSGYNCAVSRSIRPVDAANTESIQVNEEQLLPTLSSGRLFSEPQLHHVSGVECTEECRAASSTECAENNPT